MIDLSSLFNLGVAAVIGSLGLVYKNDRQRVDERFNKLEQKADASISKTEMRQILDDKLDPIKEQLEKIDITVDKIREKHAK